MSAKYNVKQYIATFWNFELYVFFLHISQQGDYIMKPWCKKKNQKTTNPGRFIATVSSFLIAAGMGT